MSNFDLLAGLQAEQARAAQAQQNAARPAFSRITAVTTGIGETVLGPVALDVPIMGQPHVEVGCSILATPNRDHWSMPHVTCGIYRWQTDDKGHFTGAWLFVKVTAESTDAYDALEDPNTSPASWRIRHFLTVYGESYKQLPGDAVMQLEELNLQ